LADGDYVVGKRRFSAFFGTDMDLYLREEGIRRLVIVGRPSNVCALYSAADGFMRRYDVVAVSDCLYSKTGEMHHRAMREFAATLGQVMTSDEFFQASPEARPEARGEEQKAGETRLAVLVVNVNKDLVVNDAPESGKRLAARLGDMQELLRVARDKGLPIAYAMDAHLPDDWEFRLRKPHGIAGTPGAEVADELAPQPDGCGRRGSHDWSSSAAPPMWMCATPPSLPITIATVPSWSRIVPMPAQRNMRWRHCRICSSAGE
jgi:nicotinamidase-related amidase